MILSKDSSNIIKGLGILLIVFHNFLHWTNFIGENELRLDIKRFDKFIEAIERNPEIFINACFSFLGHYGVQLFIFISGYGLASQYLSVSKINYKKYITLRVARLYSLVILGIICYVLICFDKIYWIHFLKWIVSVLLMINNFSYDRIFMNVGPWWYFSLALQLYLIFPLLHKIFSLKIRRTKLIIITFSFSYLLIYVLFPFTERINLPLFGNFVGHLPEFLLGIILVKFPELWKWIGNTIIFLIVFIILILGNLYSSVFPFTFLAVTILFLYFYQWIHKLPLFIRNILSYLGGISGFIFIVNGPLRFVTMPYLVSESSEIKTLAGSVLHFIVVFIVSVILSYVYKIIFIPILSKINNIK